jgi:lysophospholipase L1-like esterase
VFPLSCIAALALLEGLISLSLLLWGLAVEAPHAIAERVHTRYDAELGWVNVPGLSLPDFYGPARNLTINDQGFRGSRSVTAQVPAEKLRIVCSGDSFTLGYGVGDDETWCARLEAQDSRFETVNMGQGGYGVGQAYLWYARDAVFEHDVQVFAFIGGDFRRLLSDRFQGYGKPRLVVRGGQLVVDNVPVPRAAYTFPWLVERRQVFAELRAWQLLRGTLARWGVGDESDSAGSRELPALTKRLFAELKRLNQRRGSRLLLVYLPLRAERDTTRNDSLRRLLRKTAQSSGIAYLDLTEELEELPERVAASLYIEPGEVDFHGAEGHLNRSGNEWVAQRVAARILDTSSQ